MKLMGMHGKVHDGHCNGNIYYNMHGNDCDRNEHENDKKKGSDSNGTQHKCNRNNNENDERPPYMPTGALGVLWEEMMQSAQIGGRVTASSSLSALMWCAKRPNVVKTCKSHSILSVQRGPISQKV